MFCSSCGNQLPDGARFCPKCGASQQAVDVEAIRKPETVSNPVASQPANVRKTDTKKTRLPLILGLAGGGVLMVALTVILAVVLIGGKGGSKGNNYVIVENPVTYVVDQDDFFGEEHYLIASDGRQMSLYHGAPDTMITGMESGFFLDRPDDAEWGTEEYDRQSLYHYGKDGLDLIAEDVLYMRDSADGTAVVYATTAGMISNFDQTPVHIHVWKDGKDMDLGMLDNFDQFCISPDGSSVFFAGEDAIEYIAEIWTDGKRVETLEDFEESAAIALSNDGKTLFYYNNDFDRLYAYDSGEEILLGRQDYFQFSPKYFNDDCKQILFVCDDETYVWNQGDDDATQVADEALYLITPAHTRLWGISVDTFEHFVGVKDFRGIFLQNNDSECYYLDSKLELHSVISGYSMLQLADDGKTIVVARRNNLFKFDGTKEHDDLEDSIVADDVVGFQMTPDAEDIYILDDYNDLYYVQGPGKTVLLAESLVNPNFQYPAASMDYRGRLYFISDDELHYAVKDTVQTVEGFEGTPSGVFPSGSVIFVHSDVDYDVYRYAVLPDDTIMLSSIW